jgi:hypothetical protein
MAYKNIEEKRIASSRHYQANKDYYYARNRRYRKELSSYVNKIKEESPCTDCHKNYPYYVMDFDHLEGEDKLGLVSFFCKTGRIRAMEKEIMKCEVVCSNCHRERTYRRIQTAAKVKL